MKFQRIANHYVVKLDIGEEIIGCLTRLCASEGIGAGTVSGIGATDRVKIGLYDLAKKRYETAILTGPMEITSLLGNVTTKDGQPYLHLHINVGNEKIEISGGHLYECFIAVAGEIFITRLDGIIERRLDPTLGINLIDLK